MTNIPPLPDESRNDDFDKLPDVSLGEATQDTEEENNYSLSMGEALGFGWRAFPRAILSWLLIIPALMIAVMLVSGVLGGVIGVIAGASAQEDGAGLASGNPWPFILLVLLIAPVSVLAGAYASIIQYNVAAWSLKKKDVSASDTFSFVTGTKNVYWTVVKVFVLIMVFAVPIWAFLSGMSISSALEEKADKFSGMNRTEAVLSILLYIVMLLVVPYISNLLAYIVLLDKDSGDTKKIPWAEMWNLVKPHYDTLILYEILYGIINFIGFMVFIVGSLVTAGVTLNTRMYILRALQKDARRKVAQS